MRFLLMISVFATVVSSVLTFFPTTIEKEPVIEVRVKAVEYFNRRVVIETSDGRRKILGFSESGGIPVAGELWKVQWSGFWPTFISRVDGKKE